MVRSIKSQRIREKVQADIRRSKQSTLLDPPKPPKAEAPRQKKQIDITEMAASMREDELELKVGFRLRPSRTAFSRMTADLFFDGQKIDSLRLRILQGPLAADESEFSSVMDMGGIPAGNHVFRVEVYELWSSGERLTSASKEAAVDYAPVRREDRLISIPIVKRAAGADLEVVSESEKAVYREIDGEMKLESDSRRDHW